MNFMLVVIALMADPSPVQSPLPAATVEEIAGSVQTGSILASQGDCLAVRVYSLSRFTHVATVVQEGDQAFVYDTIPATGVRKLALDDYLLSQRPADVQLFHPGKKFTEKQAAALKKHLDAQLGRPYDIKHFATGRRCRGLHCSEYATDALIASELIVAENPARVSPRKLIDSLIQQKIYSAGASYELPDPPDPPAPANEGWCAWAWRGTKECTYDCWVQTRRWFCCK